MIEIKGFDPDKRIGTATTDFDKSVTVKPSTTDEKYERISRQLSGKVVRLDDSPIVKDLIIKELLDRKRLYNDLLQAALLSPVEGE